MALPFETLTQFFKEVIRHEDKDKCSIFMKIQMKRAEVGLVSEIDGLRI